jgi:hypothetical protein
MSEMQDFQQKMIKKGYKPTPIILAQQQNLR